LLLGRLDRGQRKEATMRWHTFWPVVTFVSLLSLDASALRPDSIVFVGELRSVTLMRPDWTARGWQADGRLVVSNSCGEETAVLRVIRSTSRLRSPQTVHFTIGEWCELPIEFPHDHWLIVTARGREDEPVQFPIFETDDGTPFALVDNEEAYRRELSEADQRRLALQPLPTPFEYPVHADLSDEHDRQFIERQSNLVIRDGRVWVVRGILLASVFPGFTAEDLRHSPRPASGN
jgi:hypothetical protein